MPARYRKIVGYMKRLEIVGYIKKLDEADEAIFIFADNNRLLGYNDYIQWPFNNNQRLRDNNHL